LATLPLGHFTVHLVIQAPEQRRQGSSGTGGGLILHSRRASCFRHVVGIPCSTPFFIRILPVQILLMPLDSSSGVDLRHLLSLWLVGLTTGGTLRGQKQVLARYADRLIVMSGEMYHLFLDFDTGWALQTACGCSCSIACFWLASPSFYPIS
jgi:hypothetical protein